MGLLSEKTRRVIALFAGVMLLAGGFAFPAHAQSQAQFRIGYQKYGTLVLLKAQGTLEKRLAPHKIEVKWTEFPAGPVMLEGLNVGSIDLGQVGETPPIFAQAAGADLVYVGFEPPEPEGEAIVVKKDSAIKTVAELKGKKVALNKGSNVHYLLVKQLEKAGLRYLDIDVSFLPPADARAAFERGSVDAWVIWDPFLAAAQKQLGARVLADGKGAVNNTSFYLASRAYAEKNPKVIDVVLEELARLDEWARNNRKDVAALLGSYIGIEKSIAELSVSHNSYGVKPIDDTVLEQQQQIADTFFDLKLIPKAVKVRDAVLKKR
ncbi:MAG: sulfonate ABC transporter substrate-binding protein [Candidatus Accumulibacter sp.]|jgi:sulfonate transport system substrate-binding protein|nr:sulfonate ABC transporter substrate-binding protein [Accumulibacter sp.]